MLVFFPLLFDSTGPPPAAPRSSAHTQLCGQSTPGADEAAFRVMQKTVLEEFPRGRILTPGEVRGDFDTLTEAITMTAATSDRFKPSSSSSSSSSSGSNSSRSGSSSNSDNNGGDGEDGVEGGLGLEPGPGEGGAMKGGWPLVDDTRGMVLFVIDYQSTNLLCRPAIRKVRAQAWKTLSGINKARKYGIHHKAGMATRLRFVYTVYFLCVRNDVNLSRGIACGQGSRIKGTGQKWSGCMPSSLFRTTRARSRSRGLTAKGGEGG